MKPALPAAIRISHSLWLGAIATALVELVTRLSVAPGGFVAAATQNPTELLVRFSAYALLLALSLLMRSGRNWARIALTIIFGGLGTVSLIAEPVAWLLDGGSVAVFLSEASPDVWIMTVSRIAHIACVLAATVLMYRPDPNAWFRTSERQR